MVVAGLIGNDHSGPPARILAAMLSGRLLYLLSGDLFAEYSDVMARPGIARLHRRPREEIKSLLFDLAANGMWRNPASTSPAPDPGDTHLCELLASWPESRLVTGDRRLLESPAWRGAALTPRSAIEIV